MRTRTSPRTTNEATKMRMTKEIVAKIKVDLRSISAISAASCGFAATMDRVSMSVHR